MPLAQMPGKVLGWGRGIALGSVPGHLLGLPYTGGPGRVSEVEQDQE